jgi:hypothetical protein
MFQAMLSVNRAMFENLHVKSPHFWS